MAGKVNIRDFFLKLGFDSSEVEKGLKNLDKEFAGTLSHLAKFSKIQGKNNSALVHQIKLLKERNKLLKVPSETIPRTPTPRQLKPPKMFDPSKRNEAIRIRQANMSSQAGMRVRDIDNKLTPPTLDLGQTRQKLKSVRDDIIRIQKAMKTATGREEMNTLKIGLQQARQEAGHLTTRMSKLTREMEKQKFVANSLKDSMRNMARSYVSMFAIVGGVGASGAIGQNLVSLRTTLLGVSGDSVQAGKDFDFVAETSERLGVNLTEATSSFGKLGAATRAAGLSGDDAREMFLAVSELSTAFNLSSADFQGVSRAMSQIMSKGKLSTEELLQLGERVEFSSL